MNPRALFITRPRPAGLLALLVMLAVPSLARAIDLTNNIANTTSGVETASGSRRLAASFGTDSASHTLSSVTLLLANTVPGSAQVALHADGNLEPGVLIATLTPPTSYSTTTPLPAVFAAGATIALSPSTTYWVVLRADSGSFDWGWTSNNNGAGAGFHHAWALSDDAGAFWWFNDNCPTQFSVTVDACAAPSIATQPGGVNASCGGSATLSVVAGGTGPFTYQWRRSSVALVNGPRISGADGASLTIDPLIRADSGSYDVIVSNGCSGTTSTSVTLSVCPGDFNCSGGAPSVQDIFDFLTAYFAGDAGADFNGVGGVTVQDLFDFLGAYFAGC